MNQNKPWNRLTENSAQVSPRNEKTRATGDERTDSPTMRDAVQMERDRFMRILGAMNDGVFIINSQYGFEYINPVTERIFGPHNGKKCYEYFQGKTSTCPWCHHHDVCDGKNIHRVSTSFKNDRVYDVFETPIRNPDGSVAKLGILHDITEHKRVEEALRLDESRFEALLQLSMMTEASMSDISDFILEQEVKLTRSSLGFLGFMNDDETVFVRHASSASAMRECGMEEAVVHFPISDAGLWAEAVRRRRSLIVNDYSASDLPKKGYPAGHVPLKRLMSVPFFDGTRIVAVAAVANKEEDYDASDVRQLTLLMDGMWKLLQRKKTEESLRESEKQLRFLSSKLLGVQEEERSRLAQELHDSIGQTLVAIKFGVENALRIGRSNDASLMAKTLQPLIPMIQNAVEEARKLYMDLRPTVLDDFGVVAAASWLCGQFRKTHPHILVEQEITLEEKDVPEPLKIIIFRIIQRALDNAAMHSGASTVRVSLTKENPGIEVVIEDNGLGFDVKKILLSDDWKRGLGLASMKERTELSGGCFHVDSEAGVGTVVRARWPDG